MLISTLKFAPRRAASSALNIVLKRTPFSIAKTWGGTGASKYGTAYVAVDRCKGCAQCVWVCDNMAKNNAIKMIMIDQLPLAAVTDNIRYEEKTTVAVLSDPMIVVGN